MKDNSKVSSAVIRRLPRYRRILEELSAKNIERISSNELSALTGYTASQIRQDFNNFGGFGQQGYGYNVQTLFRVIGLILGLDKEYRMIVVGSGNLGQAIANYATFYKKGFQITAMFDVNPKIIGSNITNINDLKIQDYKFLDQYLKENVVDIGIICTTKSSAQEVSDKLAAGNVKGIWNFAPTDIEVPDEIVLENVHLIDSLNTLVYYINQQEDH